MMGEEEVEESEVEEEGWDNHIFVILFIPS
jgi:hypothetical protein